MPFPKPSDRRTRLLIAFGVSAGCFLFTYFCLGFYYVEYEALHSSFFSGKLTPGFAFRSIYFLMNIGISHGYSFLYEVWPNVEWLSVTYALCLFTASFIALYVLLAWLPKNIPLWAKVLVLVGAYFLAFADHHIHFIITRVSYLTAGGAVLGLIHFFGPGTKIGSRLPLFIGLNLFFTWGVLTRIESAMAATLLLLLFALAFWGNIKRCMLLFAYPLLLLGALSLYVTYDVSTSTEFYKQIEPEIEAQYVERQNKIPLSEMKTRRDTVMYNMASEVAWVDPKVLTPDYLRSLIGPEKFMYTDGKQWNRAFKELYEITLKHWALTLLALLLGVTAFFVALPSFSRSAKFWWWVFELGVWGLLLVQTYTFKINDRSFLPYMSLFVFCHVLFLARAWPWPKKSVAVYVSVTACGMLAAVQLYGLKKESDALRTQLAAYRSNFDIIKQVAGGRYLVMNSTSFDYVFLSNEPFVPYDYSAFKRIYITDGHVIPFIPYYRRYLEHECSCNMDDFPVFWDYLKSIRQDVVILSIPRRMQVLQEYLAEIYGYPLHIREIPAPPLQKVSKNDYPDVKADLRMYSLEE